MCVCAYLGLGRGLSAHLKGSAMTAEANRGAESSGGGQKKEGCRELHGQRVFTF
jgi:hypothetical protein